MTSAADVTLLHKQLVDMLLASGSLRSPKWEAVFATVPRHLFVPAYYRQTAKGWERVTEESADWLPGVYSNEALATQLTDGIPTSSSSQPTLMAAMLEALDIADGMRVLEIGTGTGYNAALLAARLGPGNVVSVDVDALLTRTAGERLARAGLPVTVATGDGAVGYPQGAPFDRVEATCSVRSIPPAWLEQLAPGGRILVTVRTGLHGSVLAEVGADGRGRVLEVPAAFMPMRSQADPSFVQLREHAASGGEARETRLLPQAVDGNTPRFILGLAVPEVVAFGLPDGDTPGLYLQHRVNGSWAHALADGRATEAGPDRLWSLLEDAWAQWQRVGAPEPHQLLVEVDGPDQALRTEGGQLSFRLPAFVW